MKPYSLGILLAIAASLGTAMSVFLSKFALELLPIGLVLFGGSLTVIMLCLFFEWWRFFKDVGLYFRVILPIALIYLIGNVCFIGAVAKLTPVTMSMLSRSYVIFTTFFAVWFFYEKLTKLQFMLIFVAIMGGTLFVYRPAHVNFYFDFALLALVSSLMYAVANAIIKKNQVVLRPAQLLLHINIVGLLFYGIYIVIHPASQHANFTFLGVFFTVVSMLCFALSFFAYMRSLKLIPFWQLNAFSLLAPVFLVIVSRPFFPSHLLWFNVLGGLIMLMALFYLAWDKHGNCSVDYGSSTKG